MKNKIFIIRYKIKEYEFPLGLLLPNIVVAVIVYNILTYTSIFK